MGRFRVWCWCMLSLASPARLELDKLLGECRALVAVGIVCASGCARVSASLESTTSVLSKEQVEVGRLVVSSLVEHSRLE
ncbi:hypothetical protein BC567DRAFT_238096, partial [Phyllosticta citribraziliensis]